MQINILFELIGIIFHKNALNTKKTNKNYNIVKLMFKKTIYSHIMVIYIILVYIV
jgi:hypothetical protein